MDGEIPPERKEEVGEIVKPIQKSEGVTPTERLLARLCDGTFLKIWAYPNPFKADGKELCDLLVVFENDIFIFFDRESRRLDDNSKDFLVVWKRWEKEVITKQIATSKGAEKYLRNGGSIFLDAKATIPFPIKFSTDKMRVHKIVVAHGAEDACKKQSPDNVYGSLAICYAEHHPDGTMPFMVHLNKDDPVHVFDGFNLEIVLKERDTIHDFRAYLRTKEEAISKYEILMYCGEEDLLAHYFRSFDEKKKAYIIGPKDGNYNGVVIPEGEWKAFIESKPYKIRKKADESSYMWDRLLQLTGQNALDGTLRTTASDWYNQPNALLEMAKEPRFIRRAFADRMKLAFEKFSDDGTRSSRLLSFFPSYYPGTRYALLQFHNPEKDDYEKYRMQRSELLKIACGVVRNRDDTITKVVGIAIDAPKHSENNSEDFILLECANWPQERRDEYEQANKPWKFLESKNRHVEMLHASEFPDEQNQTGKKRIARNAKCPCKSGRKYKNCCGNN